MCIHADYVEKELRWVPSIKVEDGGEYKTLVCEKCGREFTYPEYLRLIRIINPNYDFSYTHCFKRASAPLEDVIKVTMKAEQLC